MRVFVTGASGFIGAAVIAELQRAGHHVVGLARSQESASRVAALGATPCVASLDDLGRLAAAAGQSEGVTHLAYNHGSPPEEAAAADRRAIETLGQALAGSDRSLVVTGGTLVLAAGRTGSERDRPDAAAARGASEPIALALSERGVRVSVIRLAPCVHDRARRGFVAALIDAASGQGCPDTSATAHSGGLPCTGRMPRRCSGPRLSQPQPGRFCTVSARQEYGCGTSPSSSQPSWACRSQRSQPAQQPTTSGGSAPWSEWTLRPRASSPASSWTGAPHTPGCSRTWRQASSSPIRRDTGRNRSLGCARTDRLRSTTSAGPPSGTVGPMAPLFAKARAAEKCHWRDRPIPGAERRPNLARSSADPGDYSAQSDGLSAPRPVIIGESSAAPIGGFARLPAYGCHHALRLSADGGCADSGQPALARGSVRPAISGWWGTKGR